MPLVNSLYIYVTDGSGFIEDFTDWLDSVFTVGDLAVTSVENMVKQIEKTLGKSRKIANLFIGGHGAPGWQGVGCGSSWDVSGAKSLQVDSSTGKLKGPADALIRRLTPRFNKDALVTLGGCEVGQDETLLKVLSAALSGIPVQAGKDNQRPFVPGMEGDVVRCKGNT